MFAYIPFRTVLTTSVVCSCCTSFAKVKENGSGLTPNGDYSKFDVISDLVGLFTYTQV